MGYILADKGQRIVRRGGEDGLCDSDLLLLELVARAPGLSKADLQKLFVALRMEYGPDALDAIQTGCVKFEERPRDPNTAAE